MTNSCTCASSAAPDAARFPCDSMDQLGALSRLRGKNVVFDREGSLPCKRRVLALRGSLRHERGAGGHAQGPLAHCRRDSLLRARVRRLPQRAARGAAVALRERAEADRAFFCARCTTDRSRHDGAAAHRPGAPADALSRRPHWAGARRPCCRRRKWPSCSGCCRPSTPAA